MGGRVYDPMLGSFLSIDPYIQAPDNWLNYNRYLYCYGNPQIYTDPSGYESTPWWDDPGWTAPGYYEPSPSYSQYDSPGRVNWDTDAYKNNPSWWNNNSNTNYYGTNTGPGYIYVDPQTSHGQNTTSYSSGNPVYRKSQQGQKMLMMIPSISMINTQINNSTLHAYNPSNTQTVANTISTINLTAGTIQYIGDKLISEATKYYTEGVSLYNKNNFRVKVPLLIGNVFPKVGTVKQLSKVASGVGRMTGFIGIGLTIYDGENNGWRNHHTADLFIGGGFMLAGVIIASSYVITAAGVYFISDIGVQYFTGESLTEYLLDK